MCLPATREAYNLLEEKWIPVLYGNGKTDRVGICQTLTDARNIRQIAATNPMDRVALIRFLLAVLMWCKEDVKHSLAALDEKNDGIPEDWLTKLKDHKNAFNLLGDGPRFYQDASLKSKESRPIGDLLVEFPGADSINHMRHVVHDGSYGLCPACCAMGILRLSVWAPANRFYPASVNPGSAAYALIEGNNLLQTLYANLPETNPQTDKAPWLDDRQPYSPDAVAKLTWRPRRLWLNVGCANYHCENCGSFYGVITSLCNEGGWPTPTTSSQEFAKAVETEFKNIGYRAKGKDQANRNANKVVKLAALIRKCRMDDLRKACSPTDPHPQAVAPSTQTDAQEIALLFHQLILKNDNSAQEAIKDLTKVPNDNEQKALGEADMRAKKFWDTDPHLLKDGETISLPGLGADVSIHSSQFWRDALRLQRGRTGRVTAVGPIVNKFTFQDAVSIALPDASDDVNSLVNLSADCSGELRGLLKEVTQNPQRLHPEIDASVKLLTPNTEAQIRKRLSRLVASIAVNPAEENALLHEVYTPIVEKVIASVTPGSPLRRHATRNHTKALLNRKIRYLVERVSQPLSSGTPASAPGKQKSGRKRET